MRLNNLPAALPGLFLPAALLVFCLAAGPAGAQSGLPASLTDTEFWDLFVDLSEPDGFFTDENYVSNELDLQSVLLQLTQTFAPGGVYLGVGPEQNFTYAAMLDPGIAFVIDIRRQNAMEHLMYKALFETAPDRADFLARLFSRPRPEGLDDATSTAALFEAYQAAPKSPVLFEETLAWVLSVLETDHGFDLSDADRASITKVFTAFYDAGPDIAYIFQDTDEWHPSYVQLMDLTDDSGENLSFLGSEERYLRVKRLQSANLIVPVVGDFAGPKSLRAIGAYLRDRGETADVFYVSNVESYLFRSDLWEPFYENLLTMPLGDESILIRTFFGSTARECRDPRPVIRTPLTASAADALAHYRDGEFQSQCDLIEGSR